METIWQKDGSTVPSTKRMSSVFAHRRVRYWTIATDFLLINFGFILAFLARYRWQWLRQVETEFQHQAAEYIPQQILLNVVLFLAFSQLSIWRRRRGEAWSDEVYRISYAVLASFIVLMAYQFIVRPDANSRLMMFWATLFIGGLLATARLIRRFILAALYKREIGTDRVVIVGSGEAGRGVIRTLLARPDLGYKATGFLDDGTSLGSRRIPRLGTWQDLEKTLKARPETHSVFIAMPAGRHDDIMQMTQVCLENNVRAQIVPDMLQLSLGRVEMTSMGGIPVISVRETQVSTVNRILKRLLDLAIVAIVAIPALLISAAVAIAIKLDDGGPVFYRAKRVGQDGEAFGMYKFRSMVMNADQLRAKLWEQNEADGPIFKIKDDPRLTKVGRFIRRMSIDEIPQFFNIALGQMSFVGPRPPIQDEVDKYEEWHYRRLDMRGGLTGLWQVSGRADLTFDEAVLLDVYYIENWSLAMDIRIILQTIPYILLRRGAY